MVSQQETAGPARAGAARHPLDPLSSDEISQAVKIFRADGRARPAMRFVSVSLHEPPKDELASIRPGQRVPARGLHRGSGTGRAHDL